MQVVRNHSIICMRGTPCKNNIWSFMGSIKGERMRFLYHCTQL